jgi:hypothetical protein
MTVDRDAPDGIDRLTFEPDLIPQNREKFITIQIAVSAALQNSSNARLMSENRSVTEAEGAQEL